jgi:nicotinamidase-related amidase
MPLLPDTKSWPTLGTARNNYRVEGIVDMRRESGPPAPAQLAALPKDVLFERGKAALIIIDMQNDFCSPGGWIGGLGADVSGAQALFEPLNDVSKAFRDNGMPVIWLNWGVRPDRANLSPGTQLTFNPDGRGPGLGGEVASEGRNYRVLEKGGWGAAIADELIHDPSDIHIDKHRISGFLDTPLDSILRNLGASTLFFAGVNADQCVLGTLMDANFHGYDTILVEDCTATTSPDFCLQATLYNVRFAFGFTTRSTDLVTSITAAGASR